MVFVRCAHCDHETRLGLQPLIDTGYGDAPLLELPLRCKQCGWAGYRLTVMPRGTRIRRGHERQRAFAESILIVAI
jgi:DNA-directed RNA polymerase subunit RPC12/RpoP